MTVKELMRALIEMPPDADVEICMRENPTYAKDLEVIDVTTVVGSDDTWVTIHTGELVCDHA